MRFYPIIRFLSISAYFLVFLYGDLMEAPMIFWIVLGLFAAAFLHQIQSLFVILSLFVLAFLIVVEKSMRTLFIESICFIFLLLPIVTVFISASSELLNYPMFIIPALVFIFLYPISLVMSYREYKLLKTN